MGSTTCVRKGSIEREVQLIEEIWVQVTEERQVLMVRVFGCDSGKPSETGETERVPDGSSERGV